MSDLSPAQVQLKPDLAEITRTLRFIAEPGQVVELRALNVSSPGNKYPHTESGYYTDLEKCANDAARVTPYAKGVYIVLNQFNPALLARSSNKLKALQKGDPTTSDNDITRRRWLLIDGDPVRPSGISASEAEKAYALEVVRAIRDVLTGAGWPAPIFADSSNGYHLLYRVDLPADDNGLVQRFLAVMAGTFDDARISIDQTVFNPARISKLYGTVARKGDNVPERPHRLSRILEIPESLEVVETALIESLAGNAPAPKMPTDNGHKPGKMPFDLDAWIRDHNLDVSGPEAWKGKGGRKWIFPTCPWNSDHTDRSAFILQLPNGAISAGCQHNGCKGKGWHELRDLVEPGWRESKAQLHAPQAPAIGSPELQPAAPEVEHNEPVLLTELGNSRRFSRRFRELVKYVKAWGWTVWTGKRWEVDETGRAVILAKRIIDDLWDQAIAAQGEVQNITRKQKELPADAPAAEQEKLQALKDELTKEANRLTAWALKSQTDQKINAVLNLAESDLPARVSDFDADPWLLNCQNGILNLQTGELQPHHPGQRMTKLASVAYDPAAACPTWLKFLDRIFQGNADLIGFLQRAVGYSLTGSVKEQCLFFLYGIGANGKSTFTNAIQEVMGNYSMKTRAETLMVKKQDAIPEEIAQLAGVRFMLAAELGEGQRLNESLIKDLTGSDQVRARLLYHKSFEFYPCAKPWLYGNHKPSVYGTDEGIWRRPRLIPFSVTIPENERDPDLPAKLRLELTGILAWAVRGCLDWQQEGLRTPEIVKAATKAFRDEQDILGTFMDDCCIENDLANIAAGTLYDAYKGWAEENRLKSVGNVRFSRQMEEKGHIVDKDKTGKVDRSSGHAKYSGLGLTIEGQAYADRMKNKHTEPQEEQNP